MLKWRNGGLGLLLLLKNDQDNELKIGKAIKIGSEV
jgi:hypothetical protein